MMKNDKSTYVIPPYSDKYGIFAMKVGQSIEIKGKNSTEMSGIVEYWKRTYKRKYVVRKTQGIGDNRGCIIWRID